MSPNYKKYILIKLLMLLLAAIILFVFKLKISEMFSLLFTFIIIPEIDTKIRKICHLS